jgi:hypothetical protein
MSEPLPAHKAIAIGAVLTLHLLAVWFLLRATLVTMASRPPLRDLPITLWLMPREKPTPATSQKPRAAHAPERRKIIALPPRLTPRHGPNAAIWQSLGRSLACGDIDLSPQQRERCKHRLAAMPGADAQTRALIVKAPHSDALTPAQQRLHEMRTQDPCIAEEAAHLPFCIYRIIYGNKGP